MIQRERSQFVSVGHYARYHRTCVAPTGPATVERVEASPLRRGQQIQPAAVATGPRCPALTLASSVADTVQLAIKWP